MARLFTWILVISLVLASGAAAQDASDRAFVEALMARGYYDLLEQQYQDWLAAPGLEEAQRYDLKHGLILLYTAWAGASTDPDQSKELWDRAVKEIQTLLAGKLPTRDRARFEVDLGVIYLNKGNTDVPAAASGSETARARAERNFSTSIDILRGAKEEAVKLLEESFALGAEEMGPLRRELVGMTLETEFRLAWALYGMAKVSKGGEEEKKALLDEAVQRFTAIAQSCPGTEAANESTFGLALCRQELRDLVTAEEYLRELLRRTKRQDLQKRIYYQLAAIYLGMGKAKEAADAANAALRVLPGSNAEIENACRLALAKALYVAAAKAKGPTSDKQRQQAGEILRKLEALGGRWAGAARDVMISQAKSTGGKYKELADAEAKISNGDYEGAIASLNAFLAGGEKDLAPGLRGELFYKMGLCHAKLEAHGAAAGSFQKAAQAGGDPELAARAAYYAVISYGNQFSKSKDKKDGRAYVKSLRSLLKQFPNHAERDDVLYRLARLLEEEGSLAEAAAEYEKIDGASPLRRRAADRAASCIEQILRRAWVKGESPKGESELIARAIALLAEASKPVPKSRIGGRNGKEANAIAAAARVRLARLYLNDRIDRADGAIALLKDFSETYPGEKDTLGDALFVEAWALGKAGKLTEGLARLREAQTAFPDSGRAGPAAITLALGFETLAQKARGEAATEAKKRAMELFKLALASPGCGEEDSVQMWLHLAELYVELGDWAQAKKAFLSLYKLHPNALNIREGLARCYTGLSEFKQALAEWRALERAYEPGSERWWQAKYMVALMHYKMRNYKDVIKIIHVTRMLRPSLGGPELEKKFLELEKRCK